MSLCALYQRALCDIPIYLVRSGSYCSGSTLEFSGAPNAQPIQTYSLVFCAYLCRFRHRWVEGLVRASWVGAQGVWNWKAETCDSSSKAIWHKSVASYGLFRALVLVNARLT